MRDKYNRKWVMLLAQDNAPEWAVTIGQTTYYSCSESLVDSAWRRHEDCHKQQWAEEGRIKFLVKYLFFNVTRGYNCNPYEIEARMAENNTDTGAIHDPTTGTAPL